MTNTKVLQQTRIKEMSTEGETKTAVTETKTPGKWNQRSYISSGVTLWGDRGPQPLFDAISTLITIDKESQENCGFHSVATVSFGPNKKVERALGPECGEELTTTPLPCGKASVTPRVPINPAGLKQRLQKYIDGEIIPTEDDIVKGIHILDMDFTDVDNSTAMLTLQKALTNCNNKHPLFVFVSVRKMSAKLSPLQLHMGEKGPIKTDQGKVQFKICNGNPNQYVLTDNLGPILKEQAYESTFHSDRDMTALHNYAAAVLVRQLKLQNPKNTTQVGTLGRFEIAGLSHNVHKLEWFMYNKNGTYRDGKDFKTDSKKYFNIGIVDSENKNENKNETTPTEDVSKTTNDDDLPENQREKLFHEVLSDYGTEPTSSLQEMYAYLRHADNANVPIVVHCAGPMFMLNELAKEKDLAERVGKIGAMFLAHDGEANLLGRNFNEGVCPEMTEKLWGSDGQLIHATFPNAQVLCITTETCKSDGLTFTP